MIKIQKQLTVLAGVVAEYVQIHHTKCEDIHWGVFMLTAFRQSTVVFGSEELGCLERWVELITSHSFAATSSIIGCFVINGRSVDDCFNDVNDAKICQLRNQSVGFWLNFDQHVLWRHVSVCHWQRLL